MVSRSLVCNASIRVLIRRRISACAVTSRSVGAGETSDELMAGSSGFDECGVGMRAQRGERVAPGHHLIEGLVQGGDLLLAWGEGGVVGEIGVQRERDLIADIGHAEG